jgi:hypothetical protein
LDPWCQQYNHYDHLISCFLLWCLFNSHGPKTLWLLLTPSQGFWKPINDDVSQKNLSVIMKKS